MSFDGFVSHGIALELKENIIDGKINQVYQPERDEIILNIRTIEKNLKLLISASASNPRINLTDVKKENPMTAPLFCMILRKHLCGGRIVSVFQDEFDRIIKIQIESYTELGDLTIKTLVVEIMNRHSNIVLLDPDGKIIDSIKHIDLTVSAVRQVLPGFFYELPPKQNKLNPIKCNMENITDALKGIAQNITVDKALVDIFSGMSPLLAREVSNRALGKWDIMLNQIDLTEFSFKLYDFFRKIDREEYYPIVVFDDEKKPVAFSCVELTQYKNCKNEKYETISEAVDAFYYHRGNFEHLSQRSAHMVKIINNNIDRCRKKISIHKENIKKAQNRDKYKIYGDLLTANMYKLERNIESIEVENFYHNPAELIKISLKTDLSPSQNAQRYYKLYNKAKTTEEQSIKQVKEAEEELYYLETVLESVNKAQTPADIAEIKDELTIGGYIPKIKNKKVKSNKKSVPMEFLSTDGYLILVGKNNRQNDELTIKMAYSTDIWLHTKIIPGSHTIIRTEGKRNIPESTILEAAIIAATFSKAKNSTQVPVDFTTVKNVKKPSGAKPGLVIYDNYNTVYVTPNEELVEKLKK